MKTLLFSSLLLLGHAVRAQQDSTSGYATIGELKMYYEIHGNGFPLVLIHGGGSTIGTSFGNVLHAFARADIFGFSNGGQTAMDIAICPGTRRRWSMNSWKRHKPTAQ